VSEDEAWRDGLEDDVASPLLDWAIGLTDAALSRHYGTPGIDLAEVAAECARQARQLLSAVAGSWRGETPAAVQEAVGPYLGAPLFGSREEGLAAVAGAPGRRSGGRSQ
jgi:hypothetical protein